MRRSVLERYDSLEARADKLAGEPPPGAGPVHVACISTLTDLMGLASALSTSTVPPAVRAAMRTLERLAPAMLENIADVPPEKIVEFMGEMQARLQSIIDAHTPAAAPPAIAGQATIDEVINDGDSAAGGTEPDRAPTH